MLTTDFVGGAFLLSISRLQWATLLAGCLALTSLLAISACSVNPATGGRDLVFMSEDQEIALGRQYHAEVLKRYKPHPDSRLQAYVEGLVEELTPQSHRANLVYHVTVLDSPEVNAFTLPGGYLYITRGILAYLNSEAQLVGVLGHEMGHVTARHSVRQHTASTLTGILGAAVAVGTGSRAASDLSGVLGAGLVRGYGRSHELEADRLGAEYMARLGYEPTQMTEVVTLLKNQEAFEKQRAKEEGREPRVYHGLFSTHPDNDQRLREVIEAARSQPNAATRPANAEGYLKQIDGLTFGPGEAEGVVRGNRFYHRELNFSLAFPEGWKIDNRPDKLVATSPRGDALIQLGLTDLNKRQDAETFLRERMRKRLSQGTRLDNADFDVYTGLAEVDSPYGERFGRVGAAIAGKRVFLFTAVARESGTADAEALASLQSLRPLKPEESKLAEPRSIGLITASPGDTIAKLARQSALPAHAEEQLRLLNGLYPDGEPKPGQLLKIIR